MYGVFGLVVGQTGGKAGNPLLIDCVWQYKIHQIGARNGAFPCEIREIDAQGFARDEIGRSVGREINTPDDAVRLRH